MINELNKLQNETHVRKGYAADYTSHGTKKSEPICRKETQSMENEWLGRDTWKRKVLSI
jgi:hypothetical protein